MMGLSLRKPPKKKTTILKKGDAALLFDVYDSLAIDRKIILKKENEVRSYFNLTNRHKCCDAAAHYRECPWVIVEETAQGFDHALRQLEASAKIILERKEKIRRVFILLKKIPSNKFITNKSVLRIKKSKKPFKLLKKWYVYVAYYETSLQTVQNYVTEFEKKNKSKGKNN